MTHRLALSTVLPLMLSALALANGAGCAAPTTTGETKGSTTSNVSACGSDEEETTEEAPAADEESDESGLSTQRIRVRTRVCTPSNPTGKEERCANGGIPPRCEVVSQGPSRPAAGARPSDGEDGETEEPSDALPSCAKDLVAIPGSCKIITRCARYRVAWVVGACLVRYYKETIECGDAVVSAAMSCYEALSESKKSEADALTEDSAP